MKDSADFIRIIQESDSTSQFYSILEFYPDSTRKLIGYVSEFDSQLIYEGASMSFYPNGKKESQITYIKGSPTGMAYYFCPDGKIKSALNYTSTRADSIINNPQENSYEVLDYFDSTGIQVVKNGHGYTILNHPDGSGKREILG